MEVQLLLSHVFSFTDKQAINASWFWVDKRGPGRRRNHRVKFLRTAQIPPETKTLRDNLPDPFQ